MHFDRYLRPGARLDYKFDWAPKTNGRPGALSDWLELGEAITGFSLSVAPGVTVDSSSTTDAGTTVTIWVSMPLNATVGTSHAVSCAITTDTGGRADSRTAYFHTISD